MITDIPILLEEEKVTILNVWYNNDELLDEDFYAKFGVKEPDNLKLLMHVAEWAHPSGQLKKKAS